MSSIPAAADVLDPSEEVLPLSEIAVRIDQPITFVHQLLRDLHLLSIRRKGVLMVPAAFIDDDGVIVKGLTGTLTVLNDSGFTPDEMARWLFTEDESLPGRPIDALRGDRGREVKRRAQALPF